MREVSATGKYKKDFKLAKRRGKNLGKLKAIIDLLAECRELPAHCHPHKLSGEYADLWECHVEPDWLLIYLPMDNEVRLFRLGTHSDLFK